MFSVAYIAWRAVGGAPRRTERPLPGHRAVFLSALGVGAAAFLLRLAFPVGMTVSNLQFGYFASYFFLFAIGIAGARGRWLERVEPRLFGPWLVVSAVALVVLLGSFRFATPGGYLGGWTIKAAIYAFFEPFFAWGVILGLLWLFRTRVNGATRWWRFLSARAYTVYIIHPPLLVCVARALQPLAAPPLAKFLLAGTLGCAASVLVGSLILLVPGARRVL
jgi:peptidoglycan/LPS O-acetylase OafA/YrhL